MNTINGYKIVIDNEAMVERKEITVKRSWKQRLCRYLTKSTNSHYD